MPDNLEPITQTPTISPTQPEPEAITPQSQLPPAEPNPIPSPSQTVASPEQPPAQPSNNSPKSNRFLIALALCFVLVVGGVGGYYARSVMPLSETDADTTNQNPITDVDTTTPLQPEPTTDPSADWDTFSNTAYSFKHPQDWKVTANLENELPKDQKYIGDKIVIASPTETVGIIVTTGELVWGGTGEESIQSTPISFSINGNDYQSNEAVVNNHSVRAGTSIPLNNKVYTVLFGSGYPITNDPTASLEDYKRDKNTVLQILSTFTFADSDTEAATNSCPAGMRFETNEFFNICLPQSMNPQQHVSQSKASSRYTDGNHVIQLTRHFEGGWGGLFCATSEKTKVSGYEASRTLNREGTKPSDCGSTIADIWTVITIPGGDTESYFLLEMKQVPDNTSIKPLDLLEYKRIEQSLEIK